MTMDAQRAKVKAIGAMFIPGAFPHQEREGTEKHLLDVYLIAVDGIPADFVAMACKRFIQGQVMRSNLQWRPTPPELAVECRRLRDKALKYDDYGKLPKTAPRARLTGPVEPRQPFTPYPKLWEALVNDKEALASLQAMAFDGMTMASRLFATESIGRARDFIMAGVKARQRGQAA